jgi:hypothetical protein
MRFIFQSNGSEDVFVEETPNDVKKLLKDFLDSIEFLEMQLVDWVLPSQQLDSKSAKKAIARGTALAFYSGGLFLSSKYTKDEIQLQIDRCKGYLNDLKGKIASKAAISISDYEEIVLGFNDSVEVVRALNSSVQPKRKENMSNDVMSNFEATVEFIFAFKTLVLEFNARAIEYNRINKLVIQRGIRKVLKPLVSTDISITKAFYPDKKLDFENDKPTGK